MARGINKVFLIGHLGADPEVRFTQAGASITNLRIATSESWKDKITGDRQDRTEWHRVVLFAGLSDVASKYLRKGAKVWIEGRLQTREWEKDGQKHWTTEIVANDMQMLDSRGSPMSWEGGQKAESFGSVPQQGRVAQSGTQSSEHSAAAMPESETFDDDDIPF